jgi:RimJ/RimL family protein N-acetyltransferase
VSRILINLPEVIETQHLLLQMPKAGWGEKLHRAMIDGYEDYVKWLNWPNSIPTPESVEKECRQQHAEFILRDFIRYLIIEKSNGEVIGRCAFPSFQTNWLIPQFGIAYFIRRSKRRNGYATEAAHAMSLLAFKVLKARKVEIYCEAENISSCKIPEKLNFDLEYCQRGGWPRADGELANLKTYSLFTESSLPNWEVKW